MSEFWTVAGRFLSSPAVKLVLLSLLGLALAIPLVLVWALVDERRGRAIGVTAEIADLWGGTQSLSGPVLAVPYSVRIVSKVDDKTVERLEERVAIVLPERLVASGEATSEVLHRSIYDATVYRTDLKLDGRFPPVRIDSIARDVTEVRWADAVLALSLSDVSGLEKASELRIDGASDIPFEPSLGIAGQTFNGIHAAIGRKAWAPQSVAAGAQSEMPGFSFAASITFKGSSELTFTPVARSSEVTLRSAWPHPSFFGAFLPAERKVDGNGFTATWSVPNLARSVPESWSLQDGGLERLMPYAFGVRFYVPVDFYDLTERSLKYGLLFIATAFMTVFVMELVAGRAVHPVQYLFLGVAMLLFFVLLLSLSEHLGFGRAYLAASAATGGMLSLYVGKTLASARNGLIMLVAFLVLYGLLYLVLTLEDYALLMGAIAGFVLLTAVMFLTLKVDWTGRTRSP